MSLTPLEPFTIDGVWWRPDGGDFLGGTSEQPLAGTLEFRPSETFSLTIVTPVDPFAAFSVFTAGPEMFVVYGRDSAGVPCSLIDCFMGNATANQLARAAFTGHLFVHGAHVANADDVACTRAIVGLIGLRDFVGITRNPEPNTISVGLPDGGIDFKATRSFRTQEFTHTEEFDAEVIIRPNSPASLTTIFEDWLRPLQSLLRLTNHATSAVRFIRAIDSDGSGVTFVVPQSRLRRSEQPRAGGARLSLRSLGAEAEATVVRWWELDATIGRAIDVFHTTIASDGYLDTQIVSLGSAAEAYHRATEGASPVPDDEHAEITRRMLGQIEDPALRKVYKAAVEHAGYTQKQRIRAVLKRAGTVVAPLGKKSSWLSEPLVDTRNDRVHLPTGGRAIFQPRELSEATELLTLALEANLLLDVLDDVQRAAAALERVYSNREMWLRLHRRGIAWPHPPRAAAH